MRYKLKFYPILLITVSLMSCSTNKVNNSSSLIPGRYLHIRYNFFEKTKLYVSGIRHLPISDTIVLNTDNSFERIYCQSRIKGNWYMSNDTLILSSYSEKHSKLVNQYFTYNKNVLTQIFEDKSWYSSFQLEE